MRQPHWQYGKVALGLLLLLGLVGCAVESGKVYVKDGKRYGVTSGQIWRGRWWNYYERGVSYAEGEFWDEAIADFQAAIMQRQKDQRRARTYGLHFIDYFPHRELGIVYYRLARYPDAMRELETSLRTIDTAKAKFYLNRVRKSLLEQTQRDTTPPRIVLDTPQDGLLTNRFSVTVTGYAEDDTYVSAITVNGRAQFVDLAEPRLSFSQEIALQDGANTIDIVAADLVGRLRRERITVHLDRQGPLVSLDEVEVVGQPPLQQARVQGYLADGSRITRFMLAGRQVALQSGTEWEFREEVPLAPGTALIPFEAEDAAGNVTRGEIALAPPAGGSQDLRKGKLTIPLLPRWAALDPGTIVADLPALPATPIQTVQRSARPQPVIMLRGLETQEIVYDDTIYLEGQVSSIDQITAFTVNGASLWRRKTQQLFFGQNVSLQAGGNPFSLEAADEAGNTAQRTLVVTREIRQVRQVGSRLRVILLPFEQKGTPSALAETVYGSLSNVFVNQGRFDFVERQQLEALLQELKLSLTALVDPATAAKVGKLAAADGLLVGVVTETPQALEIFIRFIDMETSVVLAATDIYGEELTLPTLSTLMEGLAGKFQRYFPLVEGSVLEKAGNRLLTDLAESHGVKRYMKLIVFRPGQEFKDRRTGRIRKRPDTILAEARIIAVSADLCEAALLAPEKAGDVQEADMVITK